MEEADRQELGIVTEGSVIVKANQVYYININIEAHRISKPRSRDQQEMCSSLPPTDRAIHLTPRSNLNVRGRRINNRN